jgi:L-lactate dehydrogenase complex protein LldG
MRSNRDLMLNRIKESLASAHLPAALAALPLRQPEPAADALVESFVREAAAVKAAVHQPATRGEAIETVMELLRDSKEILTWADSDLPLPLGDVLRSAGLQRLDPALPSDPDDRKTKLAELGRATAGLTGALAGLADTGTLALVSGPGRPRLASLLPPIHVALLPVSALYPHMAAFFAAQSESAPGASNLVFITGPSRSADIELTLTIGVHGPGALHIVLLP